MRLFVSALLLAGVSAFAQNQTPAAPGQARVEGLDLQALPSMPLSQAGCPVTLTSAHLNWPGTYLPVTSAAVVKEPNLALGFQNASGKAIRSVALTAELKVKRDVYALDATPVEVQLNFDGTADLNQSVEQLATIPLPKGLHEYGVAQVRLDQVVFADGSLWKAAAKENGCEVGSSGLLAAK